jgi:hypothetical protein
VLYQRCVGDGGRWYPVFVSSPKISVVIRAQVPDATLLAYKSDVDMLGPAVRVAVVDCRVEARSPETLLLAKLVQSSLEKGPHDHCHAYTAHFPHPTSTICHLRIGQASVADNNEG